MPTYARAALAALGLLIACVSHAAAQACGEVTEASIDAMRARGAEVLHGSAADAFMVDVNAMPPQTNDRAAYIMLLRRPNSDDRAVVLIAPPQPGKQTMTACGYPVEPGTPVDALINKHFGRRADRSL